jgi:hypothetical protein
MLFVPPVRAGVWDADMCVLSPARIGQGLVDGGGGWRFARQRPPDEGDETRTDASPDTIYELADDSGMVRSRFLIVPRWRRRAQRSTVALAGR